MGQKKKDRRGQFLDNQTKLLFGFNCSDFVFILVVIALVGRLCIIHIDKDY